MEFSCRRCGCCCKVVGKLVTECRAQLKDKEAKRIPLDFAILMMWKSFPYKFDENGRCEMLSDNNVCTQYSKRPVMCNVKRMFKLYYSKIFTFKQFVKHNQQVCELMRNRNVSN